MNNADRRRIANCFDRLLRMTYPASGVEVRPASLRSAILNERKLAMEIMGCDCGLAVEPREGGTVDVSPDGRTIRLLLGHPAEFIQLVLETKNPDKNGG